MNCRNCGAAMELFERRKYFYCRYCGTFHFIATPEQDGVQVLERAGKAPCPVCKTPLARALLDDAHPIDYCETCRGVLVPRGVFVDVIDMRRAFATGAPMAPAPLDPRELERHLSCPVCRYQMDVHPYYGPGNIVIDTCSRCDLIWLDSGELRQVVDAPGRDRGQGLPTGPPPEEARTDTRRRHFVTRSDGVLIDVLDELLS